jgi:hemolysin III
LKIREPFNGLSHLGGAALSVVGHVLLMVWSAGKPWHQTAFCVYGACLIFLYLASTLYHSLHGGPHRINRLLMIDQVGIYLLIAGTYTPVCLITLRGTVGYSLLAVIWAIAIVGIAVRVLWRGAPPWLCVSAYLVMGWLCVTAAQPLWRAFTPTAFTWLFAGGVIYTIGAVVFALERPRLWPGVFSSHELWHCFVLAGSACHYMMMVQGVLPRS